MKMSRAEAEALIRLRSWSDRRASGNPTQRMAKIWPTPLALCVDIRTMLELLDQKTGDD